MLLISAMTAISSVLLFSAIALTIAFSISGFLRAPNNRARSSVVLAGTSLVGLLSLMVYAAEFYPTSVALRDTSSFRGPIGPTGDGVSTREDEVGSTPTQPELPDSQADTEVDGRRAEVPPIDPEPDYRVRELEQTVAKLQREFQAADAVRDEEIADLQEHLTATQREAAVQLRTVREEADLRVANQLEINQKLAAENAAAQARLDAIGWHARVREQPSPVYAVARQCPITVMYCPQSLVEMPLDCYAW